MEKDKELRNLYEKELKPALLVLDGRRKKVLSTGLAGAAFTLAAIGVFYLFAGESGLLLIPMSIGLLVTAYLVNDRYSAYRSAFKKSIVAKVVSLIDPELRYRPDGMISEAIFRGSNIFKHRIDRYRGDDHVRGKIGKTGMEFSEIHAEYKTVTHDSKGNRRETWHTIFKGVFFSADFNKHFHGETYVLPDLAENLLGSLGSMFQLNKSRHGELVKLEDPDFEKAFKVYSSDQIEARYLLTPAVMRSLAEFSRKTGRLMHISFVDTRVYVLISYTRDLFEPRLFQTAVSYEPIAEYYRDLTVAMSIVEELNLNTRIWTKE